MCDFFVDIASVARHHDVDPAGVFRSFPRLEALQADGLVERSGHEVRVAADARHLES